MSATIAHWFHSEFLYRNWHYPAGWYFYDEEGDLYGPFMSDRQCEAAFKLYLRQLSAGVSPTQIDRSDLIPDDF